MMTDKEKRLRQSKPALNPLLHVVVELHLFALLLFSGSAAALLLAEPPPPGMEMLRLAVAAYAVALLCVAADRALR